jgi:aspartate aminotransferase-like enzyme
MKALGIDVVISAPQKGWSASPSAGMVMLSERREGAGEGADLHELCRRPRQVARHHGGL